MSGLRWGIAGAGKICNDFCLALKTLDEKNHTIRAIGARSKERALDFATKFNIEKHYGSHDELFDDPNVDVVYIGTINVTHKDLTLRALEKGKHVLCEKPAAMNSKDLEEILQKAKDKNCFFMEAMWMRLMPLYENVKTAITDGKIGHVKAVSVSFGGAFSEVERVTNPELGGSVMMDIGIYTVTFADMIFSGCLPEKVFATGFLHQSGVDLTSSVTLLYSEQRIAQLLIAGNVTLANEGTIFGSKGQIVVKAPFWCPTVVDINGEIKEEPLPSTKFPTNFLNSAGLRFEAEHVRQCLLEKKLQSDVVSHETSRRIMSLLEQILTNLVTKK